MRSARELVGHFPSKTADFSFRFPDSVPRARCAFLIKNAQRATYERERRRQFTIAGDVAAAAVDPASVGGRRRGGKYLSSVCRDGGGVSTEPSHMNNAAPMNIGKTIKKRDDVKLTRLYSRRKIGSPKSSHPGIATGGAAAVGGAIAIVRHWSQVMKTSEKATHSVLASAPHFVERRQKRQASMIGAMLA